jgi:hypothetical protein
MSIGLYGIRASRKMEIYRLCSSYSSLSSAGVTEEGVESVRWYELLYSEMWAPSSLL